MCLTMNDLPVASASDLTYSPAVRPSKRPDHPIGRNILDILRDEGLKPVDLAERLGVMPQQVNDWIYRRAEHSPATLTKLARALRRTVDELIRGVDVDYDASRADVLPRADVLRVLADLRSRYAQIFARIVDLNQAASDLRDGFEQPSTELAHHSDAGKDSVTAREQERDKQQPHKIGGDDFAPASASSDPARGVTPEQLTAPVKEILETAHRTKTRRGARGATRSRAANRNRSR